MNRALVLAASSPKTCLRQLSTTNVKCRKPDITKIKKLQEHFQQDNGVPIHLKGGATDYVIFYTSLGLTLTGAGSALYSMYELSRTK